MVVYNRAAHETDKQLTSALHQVRARRTNRRWQAAQATGGVRGRCLGGRVSGSHACASSCVAPLRKPVGSIQNKTHP